MLFYWMNLTNDIKNKYYDWFKCYLHNPKHFISYGEIKAIEIKEIKATFHFAWQINNISLKIINKLKFLGVPRNFPPGMGDLPTHKKD